MLVAALAVWAGGSVHAQEKSGGGAPAFSKDRAFGIPFHPIDPVERQRIDEVQLYWSTDRGRAWRQYASARPEDGSFTFHAPADGEYWFTVRTKDREGRLYPPTLDGVAPGLKVIVDSVAPEIGLRLLNPVGDDVGVRWEIHDDHLDPTSLRLEFRSRQSPAWTPMAVAQTPAGETRWRTGNAGPIDVRMRVRDRAGNESTKEVSATAPNGIPPTGAAASIPAVREPAATGTAHMPPQGGAGPPPGLAPPGMGAVDQFHVPSPPTMTPMTTGGPLSAQGPQPLAPANSGQAPPFAGPSGGDSSSQAPFGGTWQPSGGMLGGSMTNPDIGARPPFPAQGDGGRNAEQRPLTPKPSTLNLRLVNSTRFGINYATEEVGKSGLGSVKLWYTVDGRNWSCYGEDEDHESPFQVEVGGEGTYGFTLVAQSGAGMGDDPPKAGDAPQIWIEVDLTPPLVQIFPPVPGQGPAAGILSITWTAQDVNLAARSIKLSYSEHADGPWRTIAENLENTGRYQWRTPKDVPYKFFVRVEAKDRAGNVGRADTLRPVFIDLTRPKLKILGVEADDQRPTPIPDESAP